MFRTSVALTLITLITLVSLVGAPLQAEQAPANPRVVIETSEGDIVCELFRGDAPASVVNFLTYVQDGFYDDTIFHRVIRGFMIQGGGFNPDVTPKTEGLRGSILNEATNNLKNRRFTLAMARRAEPNSASAQFFINTEDNASLDHKNRTTEGFGYAVFGRVVEGEDVVRNIERTRTHTLDGMRDVPRETVLIKTIRRLPAE